MFVGIAIAQVYIPTGVSTQSGIIRNVPSTVVRVPANTYITDGNRAYLTAQVTPFQFLNTRLNDDSRNRFSNDREDNLRRLLAADREERLNELLRLVEQSRDENNRPQSNEDRYWNDREDRQRDAWRLRDDSGNSRQSNELNRNQLRALLNRENNNNNDENRNRDNDRNRNDRNDRNDSNNNSNNDRFRDLNDVLNRASGRN